MQLGFSDMAIRDLFSSRSSLAREFGGELAGKICCRLALLAAAPFVDQVPIAPPISLARLTGQDTYSVAVGEHHQLIFRAMPTDPAVSARLSNILILKIMGPASSLATKGRSK